ncbi:hypothetical protein CFC21_002806 [Triticum aestivum]|uniref:Coiled-coil domain-containing protein 47 n=3 Tax=Triticum TaxID=4564 RepID=A0A9R0Q9X8_TRITD|nr:uncharacterized protein At5g49945-like [Triticum dicoccoides]XP_044336197.1 uncharacterized protein At5g49945-like [Triticum aestivum]XP_048540129.1 uncharacterized protein At5g49945 [Triticum urartu]KAF6984859.1 hypothetical protein CFC21_002806 [Triticum aestivum]VAH07738.1 unnamed protein product [Triticum turgidum subsp. durum]
MAAPSWIRLPRATVILLLLALHLSLSLAAQFEGFDSDELPSAAAADVASSDDDDEGLDIDLPPPPPITVSVSAPSPPVTTTTTAANPNLTPNPAVTPPNPTPSLDFWDEDEFEGIPVPEAAASGDSSAPAESASSDPSAEEAAEAAPAAPRGPAELLRAFAVEIACVSFLICFVLNYFTGKRQNEAIALAWATKFATRDSIFDKNFSLLGTGDGKDTPLLLKEGQDVFKFYASGRRFCQGVLATMEMRARHDLLSKLLELVFPRKDTITFEVVMNEDAMDHVMVAVARKKAAKAMQKEERDLQKFASVLAPASAGKKWVADELAVVAESKEVAGDMITEAVLDQVLGEKAFEKMGKWFISLHFSDQLAGSYKKVLSFKFVLPDANNMADMTKLVALVPFYIDLVGRYKLSSHARSKTDAARTKAAQEAFRELQGVRQETLLRKKAEKKKLMEEAEAKLSAEVLRKKEEKERNRQMKKGAPKVKMLRS